MLRSNWLHIIFLCACWQAHAQAPSDRVWDNQRLQQQPELLERLLTDAMDGSDAKLLASLNEAYAQLPQADELLKMRAQAVLLRLNGRLDEAEALYRRLPHNHPNHLRDRLDEAAVLFENGKTREADAAFAALAEETLPAAVHANIARFRHAIARRQQWQWGFALQPVYNDNINNAPPPHCLNGVYCTRTTAQSAYGGSYGIQLAKTQPLRGKHNLAVQLQHDGTFYFGQNGYNEASARAALGWQYRDARYEWSLLPFYQIRLEGAESFSGNRAARALPYAHRHTLGTRLAWAYRPDRHSLFRIQLEAQRHRYRDAAYAHRQDGNQWSSAISFAKQITPQASLSAAYRYELFRPKHQHIGAFENNAAFQFHGLSGAWSQHWRGTGTDTRLSAHYGIRQYRGIAAFGTQAQRNREYGVGIAISQRQLQWRGWQPVLFYQHSRIRSNMPWAQRRKRSFGIGLEAGF